MNHKAGLRYALSFIVTSLIIPVLSVSLFFVVWLAAGNPLVSSAVIALVGVVAAYYCGATSGKSK